MDKPTQPSQIFARALYSLGRGCPLWIPEPNNELPLEYLEGGVRIGDVGILRPDGSFGFIFNACCPADDPVNRNRVPNGFQPLAWDDLGCHGTNDIFPPGHPIVSGGAEIQELSVEGSASLPGIPLGGGVGVSIKFGTSRGAVIIPPKGVKSRDCETRRYFRDYAMRNAIGWYEFIRENLGMEIGNGSIYFITGYDKTDCWENAVFSSSVKERSCELVVNTGGVVGVGGRINMSDSSMHASFSKRRSPPGNPYQNQALFIRGFRISVPHKFRSFLGGSTVEITSTYEASFKDALGKKRSNFPSKSGRGSSSPSGSSGSKPDGEGSSGSSSTCRSNDIQDDLSDVSWGSGSSTSDTSLEEEDIIPPSELYHPLKAINDYILQSLNHIHLVVTHDEDWISLLNSEDVEMPNDTILLERLRALYQITVKDGCASLDPNFGRPDPLSIESDIPSFKPLGSLMKEKQRPRGSGQGTESSNGREIPRNIHTPRRFPHLCPQGK
ncbi:hypothetical protein L218DRAFT_937495 [Marasmius fiardii PR-910]|nr:hypothetical protein L218DRAFT_937495 [Marasmius fiardii PR-910]